LTDAALAILDEIDHERAGKIASNVAGYVFTKDDGSKITKQRGAIRRARVKAKVSDYRFHDTRHEAQTAWSIKNVPDVIAIKMAGFKSPQMRRRYTNIKPPRRGVHGEFGKGQRLVYLISVSSMLPMMPTL
jgi:integrase